jgi:hypothetical protein
MRKMNRAQRKQSERDRLAHESRDDYGTPYQSASDWSLANREDPSKKAEVSTYVEDYSGDEDFYGDDEENQSGYSSYTGKQSDYIGHGDWVDARYGAHQYSHKRK